MRELREPCKSALESGRCKGCVGLAEPDWVEPKRCPYLATAEEYIEQIHLNLRNGEKMNKYRNRKVAVDGHVFDSVLESERYKQLKLLQRAGEIKNLRLQVPFLLQERFRKNNKSYQKIEYIADFVYEEKGQVVIEDTKGIKTEAFRLKQKLFEKQYPDLTIRIITREDI